MSMHKISNRGLGRCLTAALLLAAFALPARGDEPKGMTMSYCDAMGFLKKYTRVLELISPQGGRVAVCPEWQGRVMTSSVGGKDSQSYGFINREFIEAGKPNPHFSNYGAEDRMWLSPEGGQFSLWFKPGDQQVFSNWFTPPAMNEGAFDVVSTPGESVIRMTRRMRLGNASGTQFDLGVQRDVRLLSPADLLVLFGETAAKVINRPTVKMIGYETVNTITNQGEPMTKEKGLVSIWMLGMMNSAPQTVIMVPYKPGPESELGPVVKSDYFGSVPADRLKVTPEAILFRADGNYRAKIGTSQKRAKNVLGSIDFAGGVMTLVQFTMPDDPTHHDYMNNMWVLPQPQPYVGDVANSYNDGPIGPGQPGLGPFYEIESLSPAVALKTGQALSHHHRTVHIQADMEVLTRLAQEILGVDLAKVRSEMLPK